MQRHTFRRTEGETYIYSQRNNQAERRETYRDTHSDGQKDRHTYTIRETFRRTEGDIQRHAFRRTERQTYIYSQRNIQQTEGRHTETHSDGQKEIHTETHIQADRRTDIHIQSEKHSGGKKGDIQRHTFRRTQVQTYIYNHRNIQADRKRYIQRHTFSFLDLRHMFCIRSGAPTICLGLLTSCQNTNGKFLHKPSYLQSLFPLNVSSTDVTKWTDIHTQLEKHSGGQRRDIQRHTFRRTEGHAYIYSQRNIQANGRETYRDTHSDVLKDRHTCAARETFRRTEGIHTDTHIQTDRRADIHIQSGKHSGGQKGDIQRHTFRRTEGQTYIYN